MEPKFQEKRSFSSTVSRANLGRGLEIGLVLSLVCWVIAALVVWKA